MIRCRSRTLRSAGSCALILVLHACGAAHRQAATSVGRISARNIALTATSTEATLSMRAADGREIRIAELRGVHFDAGDGPIDLPFRSFVDDGNAVHFKIESPSDHELRLELSFDADGALHVELSDRVLSRAKLAELGLAWHSLLDGDVDEVDVPLAHPGPTQLAGDAAFRNPLAYLRQGNIGLAIVPDLDQLARERVLPQALELDRSSPPVLRHSLVAQSFVEGSQRLARDPSRAVTARRETLHLAHRLFALATPPGSSTLAALRDRVWHEIATPRLTRRTDPFLDETFDSRGQAILDDATARLLRRTLRGSEALLFVVDPNRSDATQETMSFGARSNALQLALAFALAGQRTRNQDWLDSGRRITAFALTAPNRSGLIPFGLRRRLTDGRESWTPGDPDGSRPDAYSALDASTTGRLLLELARLQPGNAPSIRSLCFDLAHFFRDNQSADGSIPAFYEAEFLRPLAADDVDPVAATAGPALFLAQWAAWTGDAESREAARRATNHLIGRALPLHAFADPSRPPVDDHRSGLERIDLIPLALATRAAIELASTDPGLHDATFALLDQIAALQQVWDPPWMPLRAFGGFGGSNADCVWNDGAGPLAAQALLDGYRLLGRRIDLERGVAGLRSTLVEPAPFFADGRARPDPAPFAATALVVAERTRIALGQVVVDRDGQFVLGIDSVFAVLGEMSDLEIALRVATFAEPDGPIDLRIVHAGRMPGRLVVNGVPAAAPVSADGRSVPITPIRLPTLVFLPPREVSDSLGWPQRELNDPPGWPRRERKEPTSVVPAEPHDPEVPKAGAAPVPNTPTNWLPVARWRGRLPPNGSCTIEVEVGATGESRTIVMVPLEAGSEGTLAPKAGFRGLALRDGDELHARLRCDFDGFRVEEPLRGDRAIQVGTFDLIDPGDDRELALGADAESARVVRFLDGREFAREIAPGHSIGYVIDTPADTAAIELQVRVSGPMNVFGATEGAVLLREEPSIPQGSRDVAMRLADTRLWSDGSLTLRFTPAADHPIQLAAIRYRMLGNAAFTSTPDQRQAPRDPPPEIEILVVPIQCAGEAARANESLKLAVFGGDEYRTTPEPAARPTIGSLARFVQTLSGGRTTLGGEVLDPLHLDSPLSDLAASADTARVSLAAAMRAVVAAKVATRGHSPQVVLAIHEGLPFPRIDGMKIGDVAGVPILLCAERSPDGSFLSCGRLAQLVLGTIFAFRDLSRPDQGAFGDLALTSSSLVHAPAPPLGPNLLMTGWASVVPIEPAAERTVRLAPSIEGRTILRLRTDPLPDRGTLYIENRMRTGAVPGSEDRGPAGLLLFWESSPGHTAVTARLDGSTARPQVWRLAPDTPATATPFHPGGADDLFGPTSALDGHSSPTLTTPQGEVPWILADIAIDARGSASFRARWQCIDVLSITPGFSAGTVARLAPLPEDGVERGLGIAIRSERGLQVSLPARDDALIIGQFDLPAADTPSRLFGRIGAITGGSFALRVGVGREVLLDSAIDGAGGWFTVDLPAQARDGEHLQLDFVRLDGAPRLCVEILTMVPLAGTEGRITLVGMSADSVYGADHMLHGRAFHLAVEANGRHQFRLPMILPSARGTLRLVLGRPRNARDELRLAVSIRDPDRGASIPLLVDLHIAKDQGETAVLLELPEGTPNRVGFLDLEVTGVPGDELLLFDASVTRG